MSKMKEKQSIPKWFKGEIYDKGEVVTNPFSGETYELNNIELSIYDFVIGSSRTIEYFFDTKQEPNNRTKEITKDLHKGLDWFKKNNAEAYMVLLD